MEQETPLTLSLSKGPEHPEPVEGPGTQGAGLRSLPYFFRSGSSSFLSLPSMYGLYGLALTGAGVFQTTLNWPSAFTSPMNTGLCRW